MVMLTDGCCYPAFLDLDGGLHHCLDEIDLAVRPTMENCSTDKNTEHMVGIVVGTAQEVAGAIEVGTAQEVAGTIEVGTAQEVVDIAVGTAQEVVGTIEGIQDKVHSGLSPEEPG